MKKHLTIITLSLTLLLCACTPVTPSNNTNTAQYSDNLWDEIADNFQLTDEDPSIPAVRQEIDWYMAHPKIFKIITSNAQPYLYYVYQQARVRHMPAEIALLPLVESGYNPFAYSRAGAMGLWQLMPGTASGYGLKINWWYDGRRDIVSSTNAALTYLEYLNHYFNGNWLDAIAAYNSGQGILKKAIKYNRSLGRSTNFWSLKLPAETEEYVPKLLALAVIMSHPEEYPLNITPIQAQPYFEEVYIGTPIELSHAAKMAGISLSALTRLNPGFSRWATDPEGTHTLLIPANRVAQFKQALRYAPREKRVTWRRYTVERGDTLIGIAKRFHTNISLLRSINHIKGEHIYLGETILIPLDSKEISHIEIQQQRDYFNSLHDIPSVKVLHHTVMRGETLYTIAKSYHVTVKQLEYWNGIQKNQIIKPGMKLTIWPSKQYYVPQAVSYRVKPGDTLSHIAAHYHTTVKTLLRHNELKSTQLQVGQIIKIPAVQQ